MCSSCSTTISFCTVFSLKASSTLISLVPLRVQIWP
ncbi:unnamed protein product [Brassica oleracea var. botrytis]